MAVTCVQKVRCGSEPTCVLVSWFCRGHGVRVHGQYQMLFLRCVSFFFVIRALHTHNFVICAQSMSPDFCGVNGAVQGYTYLSHHFFTSRKKTSSRIFAHACSSPLTGSFLSFQLLLADECHSN